MSRRRVVISGVDFTDQIIANVDAAPPFSQAVHDRLYEVLRPMRALLAERSTTAPAAPLRRAA